MSRRSIYVLSALLAIIACSRPSSAQASFGTLQVKVTDPSAAVIPGASVTVSTAAGPIRTGTTDVAGQLRLDALPPAEYTVRIASPNFKLFQICAGHDFFRQHQDLERTA